MNEQKIRDLIREEIQKLKTDDKIKLSDNLIKTLKNKPEQGMGYQVVNVILNDGTTLNDRVVLDSEFLILNKNENLNTDNIKEISIVEEKML